MSIEEVADIMPGSVSLRVAVFVQDEISPGVAFAFVTVRDQTPFLSQPYNPANKRQKPGRSIAKHPPAFEPITDSPVRDGVEPVVTQSLSPIPSSRSRLLIVASQRVFILALARSLICLFALSTVYYFLV